MGSLTNTALSWRSVRNRASLGLARTSIVCLAVLLAALPEPVFAAAGSSTRDIDFSELHRWSSSNARPVSLEASDTLNLEPLRKIIGDARLVTLGEGLHGSAEPLEFRNQLFKFLVEDMGFTAIALESGIIESYAVNEYVHGGEGDLRTVARRGITFGLSEYPQQASLIEWMRSYNAEPGRTTAKLQFYGMDVSVPTSRNAMSAIETALRFLDIAAPAESGALRQRLHPFQSYLIINRASESGKQYVDLTQEARDTVTGIVADLLARFRMGEGAYIAATSERAYEKAYQAAIAARQADTYLRQFPVGWKPRHGAGKITGTVAAADQAKSENIDWILKRHKKLLVFTHFGHAAPTSVGITLPNQPAIVLPPMMGTYLKRHYGADLLTIGHLFARDLTSCGELRAVASPTSLEGVLAKVDAPAFLLDLRTAPSAVLRSLQPVHDLYGQQPTHSLRIGEAADVIFFTQRATPAIACAPDARGS